LLETKELYRRWDANPVATDYTEQALRALKEGDKDTFESCFGNVFEHYLDATLRDLREHLMSFGPFIMTGSGSAFFAPLAKVRKYPDLPLDILNRKVVAKMMDIGILVLAGSSKEDWVEKYGVQTKLELPVENETPLIVHTWNGVKETNLPCVIATDSWLAEKYHLEPHVDATSNIAETLTNAAQELDTEFLLVLSADMPFVTAESIKQLIREAQEGGERDIYVLIVPKESIEQAFLELLVPT